MDGPFSWISNKLNSTCADCITSFQWTRIWTAKILLHSSAIRWVNGQFPQWYAPAGNHGSCIHHFGLDVCFDEYSYHDSLWASLKEGIDHFAELNFRDYLKKKKNLVITYLTVTILVNFQLSVQRAPPSPSVCENFKTIKVTFWAMDLPMISFMCAWCTARWPFSRVREWNPDRKNKLALPIGVWQ